MMKSRTFQKNVLLASIGGGYFVYFVDILPFSGSQILCMFQLTTPHTEKSCSGLISMSG